MFDRFTDRAKQTMNFARQAAQSFNHEYLGTEHILLGVLDVEGSCAVEALREMGIDPAQVRAEVSKIVRRGPTPVKATQLPFTPRAKKVLELAMEQAGNVGHNYIGTEHLLLGLIKEKEGVAAQVLINMGATIVAARKAVLDCLARRAGQAGGPTPARSDAVLRSARIEIPAGRFSGRLERVWQRALQQAVISRNDTVGTAHLLIALAQEPGGVASNVLQGLGVQPSRILEAFEAVPIGTALAKVDAIQAHPGTRVALELAQEEAKRMGRDVMGTGHLLLGLIREDGVAARVLHELGVRLDPAREAVVACLRRIDDDPIWDLIG